MELKFDPPQGLATADASGERPTAVRAHDPAHDVAAAARDAAPEDGDVVVGHDPRSPLRFTVRQLPAAVQFGATTRDEALTLARSFAQTQLVNLWFRDSRGARLLEAYRAQGGGHRPLNGPRRQGHQGRRPPGASERL